MRDSSGYAMRSDNSDKDWCEMRFDKRHHRHHRKRHAPEALGGGWGLVGTRFREGGGSEAKLASQAIATVLFVTLVLLFLITVLH